MPANQANYISRPKELTFMAKPIEFITDLNEEETKQFLKSFESSEGASKRKENIREARKLGKILDIDV